MFQKPPKPIRDKKHLQFVAGLPCCVCGTEPVQAHHLLRSGEHGMGRKSGDNWAIPLCFDDHRWLHMDGDETAWLSDRGIDGKSLAKALYAANMDTEAALNAIVGIK